MVICVRVSTPVGVSSHILAFLVVSEMPNESPAHRPVEMLPLICSGDQRKAAQLQVRAPLHHRGLTYAEILQYCKMYMFTHTLHTLSLNREKMAQAYDFALDKIGMEIMSYQVCRSGLRI